MAIRDHLTSLFGRDAKPSAAEADPMAAERKAIFDLKATALEHAQARAAELGRQATLSDYYISAMRLAEQARNHEPPLQWNAAIIADLSGQELKDITIDRNDFQPTPEAKAEMQKAMQADLDAGITQQRDLYDLDGNGQIDMKEVDSFYAEIDVNKNFNNCTFTNVTFHPATTLEIVENAQGAKYGNITCDGLTAGETLTFGSGKPQHSRNGGEYFNNVKLVNVDGGTVIVNDYAKVDNLQIDGQCNLHICRGAQVNDLHAHAGDTVRLVVENGTLARPNFDQALISPGANSSFKYASIRNGEFSNCTMRDLDFSGAQISSTNFDNCDLGNSNFQGARVSDCTISHMSLQDARDVFKGAHLQNVSINGCRIDSYTQLTVMADAEKIGQLMAPAIADLNAGKTAPAVPATYAVAETTLNEQQAAGAQQPKTAEERQALALAQAAKLDLTVMRS